MANARFSILQAKAVEDKRISNAQFRTLAALGTFGDKEGWCFPKLKTIADMIGKTRQAVNRDLIHLQKLEYIEIHHQHRPDGGLSSSLYRLIFDPPVNTTLTPHQPQELTPVSVAVDTPSTSEVDALTPHVNDPSNDPEEVVEEPQRPNVYGVYEREVGGLTQMIGEMLDEIDKAYPEGWFEKAVREAKKSTTRVTLKYIEAIMKRWKAEGLPGEMIDAPAFTSNTGRVSL
jgi:DNA replication protein DnaD